jgi:hypothetical protein
LIHPLFGNERGKYFKSTNDYKNYRLTDNEFCNRLTVFRTINRLTFAIPRFHRFKGVWNIFIVILLFTLKKFRKGGVRIFIQPPLPLHTCMERKMHEQPTKSTLNMACKTLLYSKILWCILNILWCIFELLWCIFNILWCIFEILWCIFNILWCIFGKILFCRSPERCVMWYVWLTTLTIVISWLITLTLVLYIAIDYPSPCVV